MMVTKQIEANAAAIGATRSRFSHPGATPADPLMATLGAEARGLAADVCSEPAPSMFTVTGRITGYCDAGIIVRSSVDGSLDIAIEGAEVRGVPANALDARLSKGNHVVVHGIRSERGLEADVVVLQQQAAAGASAAPVPHLAEARSSRSSDLAA